VPLAGSSVPVTRLATWAVRTVCTIPGQKKCIIYWQFWECMWGQPTRVYFWTELRYPVLVINCEMPVLNIQCWTWCLIHSFLTVGISSREMSTPHGGQVSKLPEWILWAELSKPLPWFRQNPASCVTVNLTGTKPSITYHWVILTGQNYTVHPPDNSNMSHTVICTAWSILTET
jgi:hypothetical protein